MRSQVPQAKWGRMQQAACNRAGYGCDVCNGVGQEHSVQGHEVWHFDDEKNVQRLERMIALCPACYRVKHVGKAFVNGSYEEARAHLAAVNGWTVDEAERHIEMAFRTWERRRGHTWMLDLSEIDHLCADGKERTRSGRVTSAPGLSADNQADGSADTLGIIEKIGQALAEYDNEAASSTSVEKHELSAAADSDDLYRASGSLAAAGAVGPSTAASAFARAEDIGPAEIQHVMAHEGLEGIMPQEQLDDLATGWSCARDLDSRIQRQRQLLMPLRERMHSLRKHVTRLQRLRKQLRTYLSEMYVSSKEAHAAEHRFNAVARSAGIAEAARRLRCTPEQFGKLRRWWHILRRGESSEQHAHLAAATAEALWQRRRHVRALVEDESSEDDSDEDSPGGDTILLRYATQVEARVHELTDQLKADEEARRLFSEASAFEKADRFLSILEPERWERAKTRAQQQAGQMSQNVSYAAAR